MSISGGLMPEAGLTGVSKFAAVVGQPITHSLSPVLHNAAYAALGLTNWSYGRSEVGPGELARFVATCGPQCAGLSVTMPLKREALQLAETASTRAITVGAANTLLPLATGWHADNTDVVGLADALREAGLTRALRAVVLGAGGTAQAVLAALPEFTSEPVSVVVRDRERAREAVATARRCGVQVEVVDFERGFSALNSADLVLSTVPAGAADQFAAADLPTTTTVFDVVYEPWPTELARAAAARGCRVISGLELLLRQAGHQVTAMTGLPAPLEDMRLALGKTQRS